MGSTARRQADRNPDLDLIRQYKETKDKAVLWQLYQRYYRMVFGNCFKILKHQQESEDAVMDIFIELCEKLLAHEVKNFSSWLYRVVYNHCIGKLRKTGKIKESDIDDEKFQEEFMEIPDYDHLLDESLSEEELLKLGLDQLDPKQKQCVELFYYKKKSYREIEQITGYELKKVKSFIQNGKRNLKIFISNYPKG